ncbi:hypothetical protein CPB84DRAFT_1784617 [Gymnopilus junonius]|uniref:Uncharacterized protein n=1 Tax=Gymnopilus junonius TaxID=109634 RepID=A0A9P5TK40_GYMJU|nr:hypothetical protein CPB84DRAFT_1784617 [Gymnopilus junonius]
MTTPAAQQSSSVDSAIKPQGLERPLSSLADNVQRTMGAFYDVHKALLVSRRVPKNGLEQFKQTKHVFRTECETLRQALQSAYRHAVDFATSCQRAPNDRFISAKRAYDKNLEEFRSQEPILTGYLCVRPKKGDRPSSVGDRVLHPETAVGTLFSVLEDLQSSLRDLHAFWDNHTSFLTLVVNRQTNFPSPGEETKATVELWVRYQAAILQASSSISQSADAMSVDPSIVSMNGKNRRRHTFPATAADKRSAPSLAPQGPELGDKRDAPMSSSFSHRLIQWLKSLLHL